MWLIYVIYIIAFAFSIKHHKHVFDNSTSIDLLYRIVGTRLMMDGKSPYYHQWKANEPNAKRYYHPIPRYSQKINGVTVTPAILLLQKPFANNDFCTIANGWFWIQVAAVFLSGLLLLIIIKGAFRKFLALLVILVFFCFSRNFYLHIHSAQVYVIFALIFILIYYLLSSKLRSRFFITGIIVAIAVWLKPFFLVLILPFLVRKNVGFLKGFTLMAFLLISHAVIFDQLKYWKEYSGAMKKYSEDLLIRDQPDFLQIHAPPFPVSACVYPFRYPSDVSISASVLAPLQYYLWRVGIHISNPAFYAMVAFLAVVIVTYLTRRVVSVQRFVALLFLLYLIVEFATPALRFGYYLVEWIIAATIIASAVKQNRLPGILMIAGLTISNGLLPFFGVYEGIIGESLMIGAVLIFIMKTGKSDHRIEQLL